MRTLIKSLLILVLSLLLLVGLCVISFPLWGPPVFKQGAVKALRHVGFSEAEVSLERMGFDQLRLTIERLRYQGVTVSDAGLDLGYHFEGLRRGELEEVTLAHPEVAVDFSYDWPPPGDTVQEDSQTMRDKLPARFPIENVNIDESVITLQGTDWTRTVRLDAQLTGREHLEGEAALQGEGLQIDAQVDGLWSELSGRVTASAKVDQLADWVKFGRDRGWFILPEGLDLTTEPVEIETEVGFAGQTVQDWNLSLLNQGAVVSMEPSRVSFERAQLNASGDGVEIGSLHLDVGNGTTDHGGLNLSFDRLSLTARGTLPDSLEAAIGVSGGGITWSDGSGRLTGLTGRFELASLMPLASKGPQTLAFASIEQGEFATGSGQLTLNYASAPREGEPPLQLEIKTTALDGKVRIVIDGGVSDALSLSIRVFLDSVQLADIAALFPQFDGRIEGAASGELALRLDGTSIALQPGKLKLTEGTSGRFEYLRQGWLTQDPDLNPEVFVNARDIMEIMKDPQGAPALTELAMRDLKMSEFQLQVQETESGDQSLVAQIKGHRTIKEVTVPVVLDVPIRGDIKETINAAFQFNSRM